MKRTLVLAACAALVTAIGAVSAHALAQQVYRGQLSGVTGSAVKLRLDPSETGDTDIVRSFTVRYFDVSCRGDALVTMRRAKLIGEILKRGDWNDYEIRAEGSRIRLSINGRQTIDYTETDPAIPREGLIGLQIHGGGKAEAWYRDITIVELK